MARERTVFDCNVLLQALISASGPSGALLRAARDGKLILHVSRYVLAELKDVAMRPNVQLKFKLTQQLVELFCDELLSFSVLVETVPHVFEFPRDPDDAHYIDLAIATDAKLIVSRDQDLLSLRDRSTDVGREFVEKFPGFAILTPPEAMKLIEVEP